MYDNGKVAILVVARDPGDNLLNTGLRVNGSFPSTDAFELFRGKKASGAAVVSAEVPRHDNSETESAG